MVRNRTRRKKAVSDGLERNANIRIQEAYIERVRQLSEWSSNERINFTNGEVGWTNTKRKKFRSIPAMIHNLPHDTVDLERLKSS